MRQKKLLIILLVFIFSSSLSFIILKKTNTWNKVFNKPVSEYDEHGLVKVKPGDEVKNLIKNGDFSKGITQSWQVYPLEKKDSLTTTIITKAKEKEYDVYTYVNDSSLKVETDQIGVGFEQELKFVLSSTPFFAQTFCMFLDNLSQELQLEFER